MVVVVLLRVLVLGTVQIVVWVVVVAVVIVVVSQNRANSTTMEIAEVIEVLTLFKSCNNLKQGVSAEN